jgi:hypothetical protein
MSLYVDDRLVCWCGWKCISIQTSTPDAHLHTVTYTRCHIDTNDSPDDENGGARNMYRIRINTSIYEKGIVRQVDYLPELKRDAVRSAKHKKNVLTSLIPMCI